MSTRPDPSRSATSFRTAALNWATVAVKAAAAAYATAVVAVAAPAAVAPAAQGDEFASADGQYLGWLDRSVAPSVNFFRFANGGWLRSHPIPADQSYWGVDAALEQENQKFIRGLIESLAKTPSPPGSAQRKIADFYVSGMDESGIEAAGLAPLQAEFARIAAVGTAGELPQAITHLQSIGVSVPLQIGQMQDFNDSAQVIAVASQGGLGLPNRDYYLKSEPNFVAVRAAYVRHLRRMFVLLGDARPDAVRQSKAVMALETRLAAASMSEIEQRNPGAIYHPVTLEAAQTLTSHVNWRALFSSLGHPEIRSLNMGMPRFFQSVDRELAGTPLADWKAYLRSRLIDSCAPYLSKAFVDEDFRMTAALEGARRLQERWLRVLAAEDEALGFAIGQLYVAQKFPPAAKEAAEALVSRIRDALRTDLETLAWMTPATRQAAQQKLDLMELRVGYPDRWRDYSGLEIDRGPYVLNVLRANEFEQKRQLDKIGKPVDRSEWTMTPQTVNAYYDLSMNSLSVPAGTLQRPYFDVNWPDAVNYGSTGAATIGHEMTHGFDDEGARFDGHGNFKDWWARADLVKFREATRCIAEQYSRLTVSGGLHVQGELVAGEAVADLGGLMLAWRAFHALRSGAASTGHQEFTPDQQFFIAFAQSWSGALRPQAAQELITTDPHPPAEYRANATLANSREFQAAFGIPESSPMVNAERCVIW
ncbi:MAG TPA: M13 family metallopeptidase [Steroidobacteraceae bacterium]|nr:M13 family metallopeptidase [Steroidobacteraceae bacterium]